MQPLDAFPIQSRRRIKGVLTDIDGTLSTDGRLTAEAYGALERLHDAGFLVIPVTGRPAGWCDHIARMWPIDGVVGENGAFYFRYDPASHDPASHDTASHDLTNHDPEGRALRKRFLLGTAERKQNRRKLDAIRDAVLAQVPGTAVASDQPYREADLAIDYCEDVAPLDNDAVARIVAIFTAAGATAKVSSIHVNGWFGTYDKLAMSRILLEECFDTDLDADKEAFVFIGDSPNDAPMFGFFPYSVGVANVRAFAGQLSASPAFVTAQPSGAGFAELVDILIAARA